MSWNHELVISGSFYMVEGPAQGGQRSVSKVQARLRGLWGILSSSLHFLLLSQPNEADTVAMSVFHRRTVVGSLLTAVTRATQGRQGLFWRTV